MLYAWFYKKRQKGLENLDLEGWACSLDVDPTLDSDTVTTVSLFFYSGTLYVEPPFIGFLANHVPGVEIAITGQIGDSITDELDRYECFYPLDREFCTGEEKFSADEGLDFDYMDPLEEDDGWFEGGPDWAREWANL